MIIEETYNFDNFDNLFNFVVELEISNSQQVIDVLHRSHCLTKLFILGEKKGISSFKIRKSLDARKKVLNPRGSKNEEFLTNEPYPAFLKGATKLESRKTYRPFKDKELKK